MKKFAALVMAMLMTISLVGCKSTEKRDSVLSENLPTVLEKIYEISNFSDEQRESMKNYQTAEIDKSNVENYLGTSDIEFEEAICSAPMMSSIPYELILLRVDKNSDVESIKETIKKNANPRKWICVEAEEVVVENIDNTILFMMANKEESNAVKDAFISLGEGK